MIWSVSGSITREERSRLIKLLPDLLKRLRKGLEQISYNPFEMTQLLKRLEQVHLQQLKAATAKPEPVKQLSEAKPPVAVLGVTPVAEGVVTEDSVIADSAIKHSAIEAPIAEASGTEKSNMEPGSEPASVESPSPQSDNQTSTDTSAAGAVSEEGVKLDEEYLLLVDRLSQGCWFEMSEPEGGRYRCRLAAIIKSVDKYIFVNRNGMKVAEKNRVELASALRSGKLRQLDDGMLFDRALESVIGSLRQRKTSI